jgi:DNA polymerase theta
MLTTKSYPAMHARVQVTEEQRNHAKRLAYGLLYGMGNAALAAELGVDTAAAANLAEAFRKSLPGLDAWLQDVVNDCKNTTFIRTLAGRKRYLPGINSASGKSAGSERARAARQAVNSVCQGSAADVVKRAMIDLQRRLERELLAEDCKMLLQVCVTS